MNVGTMAPRCKRCSEGRIVLYTGSGKKVTSCFCAKGQEFAKSEETDLKAKLLAAFNGK